MNLHPGQKISGTVDTLAFGGSGIIRYEGMVLFVPDVIPGETVLVEVTEVRSNYAKGKLLSIECPSPDRITPLCPFFGACGGCQLQHIAPARHPAIKVQWLKEALHGLVPQDMPISFVPAQEMWAWRRKITLHARWDGHSWLCGYVGRDNTSIVPVNWCPIFCSDDEKDLLPELFSFLDLIPGTPDATIDLSICRLPDHAVTLLLSGTLRLSKTTKEALLRNKTASPRVRTLSLRFPGLHLDDGPTEFTFSALNSLWHFSHEAFIQNHPALGERLWSDVIATVERGGPHQTILDLYSGIGVTAIHLALQSHTLTAVELSSAAVAAAKRSARECKAHLRIVEGSVEKFLASVPGKEDCWIVNPPRQGLSREVLTKMIEKKPKRVVYVSCSPPTLARDLRELIRAGFSIASVQAYDLFPQTSNLETIATLNRP